MCASKMEQNVNIFRLRSIRQLADHFMPNFWSHYSLQELRAHQVHSYRRGGGTRPDVLLIEIDGKRAVLKDQNGADKWFAQIIGPILNWRECKALRKLAHLDCTPTLLARPDARSFLMTHHESQQITKLDPLEADWPEFFLKLVDAIEQIHAAGVAHNDLRNPTNTLVTPDGDPILVDVVACFCRGQRWNIINRWLFHKFTQVDRSAVRKLKQKFAPDLVTDLDIDARDIAGRPGMWVKGAGQIIRKLSRRLFTGSKH